MDPRPSVSALEVVWVYLAHEHEHKDRHKHLAEALGLRNEHFPLHSGDLADVRRHIHEAVVDGRCPRDVLCTIEDFVAREWELTPLGTRDLGDLASQLPGELDPRGKFESAKVGRVRELFDGWRGYLTLEDSQARTDAAGHLSLLSELKQNGRFKRPLILRRTGKEAWRIGDGRHRAFAAFEFSADQQNVTIAAYRER